MHFERKSLDRPTMKYISFFITYCICLSIGFCLLFSVQSSFAKDSSDEDVSWYEQFINSIGETLYFMAWPTATYEKVSFKGISRTNDGVNIKVKLHGKSAFDESSLWTEVILVINSGGVKDIRWRKHNGIIAEPGETMTNFVKLLDEINKEYNQNRQLKDEMPSYYVACIRNNLRYKIFYQYRWSDDKNWTNNSIETGSAYWHGSRINQKLFVKFDNSYSEGYQETEYYLENKFTKAKCDGGKQYEFYFSNNKIDMKSVN